MLHSSIPQPWTAIVVSPVTTMNVTLASSNFSHSGNISLDPLGGHAIWEVTVIVFITVPLSLVTIIGNLLVIVAFRLNGHLRTVSNYFLLSLAVADLILGTISMNLYTTYIIMDRWVLGNLACDIWLAIDYVASNASVMNLLVISFDRFFSITRPLTYRVKRTPRRAAIMISLAWAISFVLWAPAILFWQYVVGERTVGEHECFIQFFSVPIITFGTAIAAFYLPVTIMIILYWRIYRETENRARELEALQGATGANPGPGPRPALSSSTKSSSSSSAGTQAEESQENQESRLPARHKAPRPLPGKGREMTSPSRANKKYFQATSNGGWNTDNEDTASSSTGEEEEPEQDAKSTIVVRVPLIPVTDDLGGVKDGSETCASSRVPGSGVRQSGSQSSLGPAKPSSLKWPKAKKGWNTSLIREKKAARTLSAILLAFILTWTPYNIMVLVSTFCEDCVPDKLWRLGYYLCYVNSTVNPMCYALCNKSFRVTFKMLLLCHWDRRKWVGPHLGAPSPHRPQRPHKSSGVA